MYYKLQNLGSHAVLTSASIAINPSGLSQGKFKAAEITQTRLLLRFPQDGSGQQRQNVSLMRGLPKCTKHYKEPESSFDGALHKDWIYSQGELISAN